MFDFVLFLVMFVFLFMIIVTIFAPLPLPSLGSLVSYLPRQLDMDIIVWFFELCVAALFFVFCFFLFLDFCLVLSCRPSACRSSVDPSPRHIIGLIVPANSNRVPSGLGLRPASMHKVFCFGFLSSLFFPSFFAPFCPFLSFFA